MLVFDKNIFGSNREIDSNGYLRVSDCSITKTQVAPYLAQEIPNWKDFGLERDKIYYVLRPEAELKKAVETFNNLPLTRKHIEVDVDNVPKEDIVGSLGDSAVFEDGYLKNNLIVYDQKYIDRIENGKQKELSCGYRYTPVRESGEYNGQHYDFVMKDIIGNHVALVKEGRAGHDVMVSDTIEAVKDKIMGLFGKKQIVGDEFKESEHPRSKENGRFIKKGGSYPFEDINKTLYPDDKEKQEQLRAEYEKRSEESKKEEEEKIQKAKEKVEQRWADLKARRELVKKELEKLNNPDPKIIKFYGEEIDVTKTDEVRLKEILEELESLHEQGEAQKKIRNELERRKEEGSESKKEDLTEDTKEKIMQEVDELAMDSWGEETEYNGQKGHYLTTKSGHHIFIPNGTTTKEAIQKHFEEIKEQKKKELGENPWRESYAYKRAKESLENVKKNELPSKKAFAVLDEMIKELEEKESISIEKEREYNEKIDEIYAEYNKSIEEAEAESNEGKPESKIKEETEYEDIEFKTPRQREPVEKNDRGVESHWQVPVQIDFGIPENDNISNDILEGVMGQMSDGMWENSRAVEKYWENANINKKDGTIGLKVNQGYGANPYNRMSDEEIRGYFAKKIKAVVKQELEDYSKGEWSRDNEAELQYLSRSNRKPVRVKDAYKLYDHLLGRK